MTYSKIYVPSVIADQEKSIEEKDAANIRKPPRVSIREVTEEKLHCPEIVITNDRRQHSFSASLEKADKQARRKYLPSIGSVLAVIALCFASFIVGCSVTDSALSSAIISIAAATYGKIPENDNNTGFTSSENENTTFYNKYMQQGNDASTDVTLDYLAANPYSPAHDSASIMQSPANSVSALTDIPAESTTAGRLGADGEILYPVLSKDLSAPDVHSLSNQTSYSPDTHFLLSETPAALSSLAVIPDKPLVLIVHTHGTEGYNSCEKDGFYSTSLPVRSENTAENVVGIGEKIASVLESFGIPALHSTKMCDKDSFVHAYSTSAAEVKTYLQKYPSIRFVIDLHRDSIESADKTKTKPLFSLAGQDTAQLMFVVGTDAAGAKHSGWMQNLSLALTLQSEISADYPALFRRINLRTASFNQQLSDGYLLLECGSCANSFKEAENAAEMFATGLARVIKKYAA